MALSIMSPPKHPKKRYIQEYEADPEKSACSALMQLAQVCTNQFQGSPKQNYGHKSHASVTIHKPSTASSSASSSEQPLNLSTERTYKTSQQQIINVIIEKVLQKTKGERSETQDFSFFRSDIFTNGESNRTSDQNSDSGISESLGEEQNQCSCNKEPCVCQDRAALPKKRRIKPPDDSNPISDGESETPKKMIRVGKGKKSLQRTEPYKTRRKPAGVESKETSDSCDSPRKRGRKRAAETITSEQHANNVKEEIVELPKRTRKQARPLSRRGAV